MATLQQIKERPVRKFRYTRAELILEIAAALGFITMLALIILAYPDLPAKIPAHFGANGHPDRWMVKESIFTLPIIDFFLYIMLTLFFFFPNYLNYFKEITEQNADTQYRLMRLFLIAEKSVMAWMFTYTMWTTVQVALKRAAGISVIAANAFLWLILAGIITYVILSLRAKEDKPQPKSARWQPKKR